MFFLIDVSTLKGDEDFEVTFRIRKFFFRPRKGRSNRMFFLIDVSTLKGDEDFEDTFRIRKFFFDHERDEVIDFF